LVIAVLVVSAHAVVLWRSVLPAAFCGLLLLLDGILAVLECARDRVVVRAVHHHRPPPVAWIKSVAAIARMSPVSNAMARPVSAANRSAAWAHLMAAHRAEYIDA
jgi:hypothetical protein